MDNTQNNTARKQLAHPKLAMVAMLLGAFVGMLSETSLNIALPKLMLSLRVNMATIQWLVTGYMLVIGIILPLSSLISKWFTTRQIIIFGLLSFIIGAVISACASSFPGVLIGRMVQGIGTGFILPLMFAVAMQIFPPLSNVLITKLPTKWFVDSGCSYWYDYASRRSDQCYYICTSRSTLR